MASLPEKDAEEDHGDAGLTTSSKRVESLGVRVSDLRSSVMRMDLGKARQDTVSACGRVRSVASAT